MGKFETLQSDIFSVFGSASWVNEDIKTVPENFVLTITNSEYIRVAILPGTISEVNINSISGQLMIDIFTPAGKGPLRAYQIADKLDEYLNGKTVKTGEGSTQFRASSLNSIGQDVDNKSLFRSLYTISFNYFGVF